MFILNIRFYHLQKIYNHNSPLKIDEKGPQIGSEPKISFEKFGEKNY